MVDQLPVIRGVFELVEDGGPFVGLIFAAGVLMWAIIAERYWFFKRVLPQLAAELQISNFHFTVGRLGIRVRETFPGSAQSRKYGFRKPA